VTGAWRKLYNEELHNLYSSKSIIRMFKSRRMRWAGHVARMRAKINAYRILVGKPEGKRPTRRWVDNIKIDAMDWIDMAQDRDHWRALVNTVMNLRVT
jgi:alanine-alpha-ketoisovalerate/valine-pyruvate aminotransferase